MGPTWVLSAPNGPHVGPMNLAIREVMDEYIPLFCAVVITYPFLKRDTDLANRCQLKGPRWEILNIYRGLFIVINFENNLEC